VLADKSRAIYLDSDLIVEADLGELYDTPLDGMAVGAVIDRHVIEEALKPVAGTERHRAELLVYLADFLGLETEQQVRDYRQGGVLVMDLDAMRATNFATLMGRVLEQKAHGLRYADQCAINHLLSGRMAVLDPRWNVLAHTLAPQASVSILPGFETYVALQRDEPFIIHFAGRKPWLSRRIPGAKLWWKYARDSGRGRQFYLRYLRERLKHRLANLRLRAPSLGKPG
jgi:lipopolysaccharide biosynthesis glycosyltransferase